MDGKSSEPVAWSFDRPIAILRGAIGGRIDLSHPERGLHDVAVSHRSLPGQLLCVSRKFLDASNERDWPLNLGDAYVRGEDLVASYEPADSWPYLPQIYWRASTLETNCDSLVGSLSLLISVQTHLLDTWPRISIRSQLACSEMLLVIASRTNDAHTESLRGSRNIQSSTGVYCVVRRLAESPLSYAEIMPCSDFREVATTADATGACCVEWELFADFLEKGVIWRSRLQSVFLPRENDVALAVACCKALEQRPLPLTV